MNKYEEMSDLEVNYAVASLIFKVVDGGVGSSVCAGDTGKGDLNLYDYCNNAADMWPIIIEYKISILQDSEPDWCAHQWLYDDAECWHQNPLRAAAIVFLMIKDAE